MIQNLRHALSEFASKESALLIMDSNESSIASRLVEYLSSSFEEYKLDIETRYDARVLENDSLSRQMDYLVTRLPLDKWPKAKNEDEILTKRDLLPDIIFQDNGSRNKNYLVIEVKKTTNKDMVDRVWDIIKLAEMTSSEMNYRFGAFIEFTCGEEFNESRPFKLKVFEKGEIIYKN